ncbi:MAG TPA: hypothetical protein VD968_11035, partial [Pyrinomonadaceae bacterium]|nr:hypothetical protein [Pyrinomonadaceae bacterium]
MTTRTRPRAAALLCLILLFAADAPAQRGGARRATKPKAPAQKPAAPEPRLVVQLGHSSFDSGFAAFSADGRLVATGSGADQTAVIWDVASGREVRRLEGNAPPDDGADYSWMSGAFSPDGRLFAVGLGPYLRVWDIESAKVLGRLSSDEFLFAPLDEARPPVAFSPDGRRLVTHTPRSRITWDVATGRVLSRTDFARLGPGGRRTELEGPRADELAKSLLSPDGRLRVAVKGGAIVVTDKASGAVVGRVSVGGSEAGDTLYGWALALSPDNRTLVTVGTNYVGAPEATLWDVATGRALRQLEGRAEDRSHFVFTPEGGILNAAQPPDREDGAVRLREMVAGREWAWAAGEGATDLQVSPDGRFVILTRGAHGEVYDAGTGARLARVEGPAEPGKEHTFGWDFAGFTPDETFTFFKDKSPGGAARLVRLSTRDWKERAAPALDVIPKDVYAHHAAFAMTPDTKTAAWETRRPVAGRHHDDQLVTVWRADDPTGTKTFMVDADEAFNLPSDLALSPDGARILVATGNPDLFTPQAVVKVYDAREGRALFQLRSPGKRIGAVAWSPDGRTLATYAPDPGDPALRLWDAATGRVLHRAKGVSEGVADLRFSPDGRLLLAHDPKGFTYLFDVGTGAEVGRMLSRDEGDWVVVDPQGRFDTNNLEELKGVHWLAPDDPLKPLPLEIFMREYYEPRLLARLLAGEKMNPVRSLSEVNRAQPSVRIKAFEPVEARPELVNVTVEVSKGAHDLRLFREGQLVAYAPEEGGEVKTGESGRASVTFRGVRLPRNTGKREVEFTAYAFNEDRVKSATARETFALPETMKPAKGRAYVVSVGVNAYENEAWDLRFAANDARRLREVVAGRLAETGEYEETVSVSLVSDFETREGRKTSPRVVTESSATKANFRAVLDLLAGRKVDDEVVKRIPGAEKLRAATPEDLVIISFSSHGYADEAGEFYLLPYDTGPAGEMRDALSRAVSSGELSLWLRDVDAGELVLVVDACHSAASVQGEGFKPGPMGSRGMGQLSYDKGMRILASTQADDVALESRLIEQGLLTYALTRDAVERARADFRPADKSITVAEWLAYGVERVPVLHEEV